LQISVSFGHCIVSPLIYGFRLPFGVFKHFLQERFEDTKGVIRSHKSKKDRQSNGQKNKDKRTNNDLQNITQKTKDRATRTPLKHGVNSGVPEG
jgi:hypothetical protein